MTARPIFFIYGQKDSYIREEHTRLLYAQAADPKFLWIVEGAKHNQAVRLQPRQYAQRTIAFFRRYLADEPLSDAELMAPAQSVVA